MYPCPEAIFMYKTWKNVHKLRELQQMGEVISDVKSLSPRDYLPLPQGYKIMKKCYKSEVK